MKAGLEGNTKTDVNKPWLEINLSEVVMNHLWDILNHPQSDEINCTLAGNISESKYLKDKDNFLYENVLKQCAETLYFKDWNNYNNVHIAKSTPPPKFWLKSLWSNIQKQHEFNPPHDHDGIYSFAIFMKIPTYSEDQHALPFSSKSNYPCASDFQFLLGKGHGILPIAIPLSPEDEGRMLFFPAGLYHQVLPFYECEEERITIAGNIIGQEEKDNLPELNKRGEQRIHDLEREIRSIKSARKINAEWMKDEKESRKTKK